MASNMIDDCAYNLKSVIDTTAASLSDCTNWQDDVRRSYDNFINEIQSLMTSIRFHCDRASDVISNAESVDVERFKSEFEGLVKKVESI